jgi:hypothetical protein
MKTAFEGHVAAQARLQKELRECDAQQDDLGGKVLKAELLDEPDLKEKRAAAVSNAARIIVVEDEIKKSKKSAEILDQELKKIEGEVVNEIRAQHRPAMQVANHAYLKALRAAAAAEVEIERVQELANAAGAAQGIAATINLETTGTIRVGTRRWMRDLADQAEARAKLNGFDV